MTRYRVGALSTGMIYEDIDADSEEEAKEIMLKRHGDESIELCHYCAKRVGGLAVSEDTDMYEVEEIAVIV